MFVTQALAQVNWAFFYQRARLSLLASRLQDVPSAVEQIHVLLDRAYEVQIAKKKLDRVM